MKYFMQYKIQFSFKFDFNFQRFNHIQQSGHIESAKFQLRNASSTLEEHLHLIKFKI